MPPPRAVEKAIGEKRVVNFAPVGISLCPELDVEALLAGIGAAAGQRTQACKGGW
jgi:glycerol-3-phosphate O-acyltransferase